MSEARDEVADAYRLIFAVTRRGRAGYRSFARKQLRQHVSKSPEVMVKITGHKKGRQALVAHATYISRNGELPLIDSLGMDRVNPEDERQETRAQIRDYAEALETASKTAPYPGTRIATSVILSMPRGTDKAGFRGAVSEFLAEEFSTRDYLYVFHDTEHNKAGHDHYHAHVILPSIDLSGERLATEREDLAEWRVNFAQKLNEHGIAAVATPAIARGKRSEYAKQPYKDEAATVTPAIADDRRVKAINAWRVISEDLRLNGDRESAEIAEQLLHDGFNRRSSRDDDVERFER